MPVGFEKKHSPRWSAHEQSQRPYDLRPENFPAGGSAEEQFRFLLRYGILAPSSNNAQPWRFRVTPSGIEVYGDPERRLPGVDPNDRELLISIGALVFNLRVAASFFGFHARVRRSLEGDIFSEPAVTVELVPQEKATGERFSRGDFLPEIPLRHTNRDPFLPMTIPGPVLASIREVERSYDASLVISTVRDTNVKVAQLVSAAERRQFDDRVFREELASWMRLSDTRKSDGMPGTVLGSGMFSGSGDGDRKIFDISRVFSPNKLNLCIDAPALLILQSDENQDGWVETGEMLEHILLTVTRLGLQSSYFNMAIEVPEFRMRIRNTLGIARMPQLLLRLGYAEPVKAVSPRRPLEEFLLAGSADLGPEEGF